MPRRTKRGSSGCAAVDDLHTRDPLADGLSRGAARDLLGLPDESLLDAVARDAGLEQGGGHIRLAGVRDDLGPAEAAVAELETRLRAEPFPRRRPTNYRRCGSAPANWPRPSAPVGCCGCATARSCCCRRHPRWRCGLWPRLEQPFTTSQARQALYTTRRVAIPLLEHLDARGWTRRLDAGHREVVR